MDTTVKIPNLQLWFYRFRWSSGILNLSLLIKIPKWNYLLDKNHICSLMKLGSYQRLLSKHFDSIHYIYHRIHSNIFPIYAHCLNFLFQCYQNQNMNSSTLGFTDQILGACINMFLCDIKLTSLGQRLSSPMKYDISLKGLHSIHWI